MSYVDDPCGLSDGDLVTDVLEPSPPRREHGCLIGNLLNRSPFLCPKSVRLFGWRIEKMERWLEVGWEGSPPDFIAHSDALPHITAPAHLFFPSLPGPVVGEMPSATRYAAVGVVGRPLHHVVRDAFCEGDEGIAEVAILAQAPAHLFFLLFVCRHGICVETASVPSMVQPRTDVADLRSYNLAYKDPQSQPCTLKSR